MIKNNLYGVMIAPHKQDGDMLEIYTKKYGKDILWGVVHADILDELRGNITLRDLENSEYEICIHAPSGRKKC